MSYGRPSIDLESYAGLYRGRSKILRLQHIAHTDQDLELDALRLAVIEAKKGRDSVLYKNLVTQLAGRGGPLSELDEKWIAKHDKDAVKELDRLRRELDEIKEQNSKEAVRMAHNDLGDFFHARGKLAQARGEYLKTRDYCSVPAHTLHLSLCVIVVSIEAGDFPNVDNYHLLAEHAYPSPDSPEKPGPSVPMSGAGASASSANSPENAEFFLSLARACAGLSFLVRGRYSDAAKRFISVATNGKEEHTTKLSTFFGDPLSLEDVATLGTLCALATFTREELKSQVIESDPFKALLELVPDVRELVGDFYSSRYTRCLDTLKKLEPDLRLDMHVSKDSHVSNLYSMMRQKMLVQYVSPFESVDLTRMEKVFQTTEKDLEAELLLLIQKKMIGARIDTQKKALYRRPAKTQTEVLEEAVVQGEDVFNEVEAMMLRMAMVKNGLTLRPPTFTGPSVSGLGPRGGSINSVTGVDFLDNNA